MALAAQIGLGWLVVSVPVSLVTGLLLRSDRRELIAVDGPEALYLMPDGTVTKAPVLA